MVWMPMTGVCGYIFMQRRGGACYFHDSPLWELKRLILWELLAESTFQMIQGHLPKWSRSPPKAPFNSAFNSASLTDQVSNVWTSRVTSYILTTLSCFWPTKVHAHFTMQNALIPSPKSHKFAQGKLVQLWVLMKLKTNKIYIYIWLMIVYMYNICLSLYIYGLWL